MREKKGSELTDQANVRKVVVCGTMMAVSGGKEWDECMCDR